MDKQSFLQKILLKVFAILFLTASANSFAGVFEIVPTAGTTLPGVVYFHSSVMAYYTVRNHTHSGRQNNFVKYLPPNVTQITSGGTYADTCGATFNLNGYGQAGDSCTLQLQITGAVNSSDPLQTNHLFVCFPGGLACSGTDAPLNVSLNLEKRLVSVAIAPASATIVDGTSQQYTAVGTYTDGSQINLSSNLTWHSSSPSTVAISSSGLATALAVGMSTITASINGITSNSATLTVSNPLVSIAITPLTATVGIGVTQQFTATGTYTNGSQENLSSMVNWLSSATSNATISATGLATGMAAGSTSISASFLGVTSTTAASLTVINQLVSITVTPASPYITNIGSQQFTATGTYHSGSTANLTSSVTWNSGTPGAATISSAGGLAQAVALGSTAITASLDGVTSAADTLNVSQFAYISAESTQAVFACPIDPTTHAFGTCTEYTNGFGSAFSVAVNSAGTYLYEVNNNDSAINQCTINTSTGALTTPCATTGGATNGPTSLSLNTDNSYLYFANLYGGNYGYCSVDSSTGALNCNNTGSAGQPSQVAVNYAGTGAYTFDANLNELYYCSISGGAFQTCNGITTNYTAIGLNVGPGGSYVYLMTSGTIYVATPSGTTLTNFTSTGSGFSRPRAIAFNSNGTYAYVINQTGSSATYCQVSATDGTLSNCTSAGGSFGSALSITIH